MDRQIRFVCQHGALRCRIAAAYFNANAPEGWHATTAGATPQSEVSPRLGPLLEGTEAEAFADYGPPIAFEKVEGEQVFAIDTDDVAGAKKWTTDAETDEELREQIRQQVQKLIDEVSRN